ncbi:MAG: pyridoxamine 5'-phosphate oxidase [Alphaproteobacteria bacterium]|nr:pyridoxamine 5'-phosphate oxidase [Alphaproteobacteria bacterium]
MEILRGENPLFIFQNWMAEAEKTEPSDPNAMALATATPEGVPSVRMVLLKDYGEDGFTFYTNAESRKGLELVQNPQAALCLHWKSLDRQVRIEGRVEKVPAPLVDAYFKTRHYLSRLGAWASSQSQPLDNRIELEERVKVLEEQYGQENIPRPPHWAGYRVVPEKIEFWQAGAGRLHDRFLFTRTGDGWDVVRLNP